MAKYTHDVDALGHPDAFGQAISAGDAITLKDAADAERDEKFFTGTAEFVRAKARRRTIDRAAKAEAAQVPPWFTLAHNQIMNAIAGLNARVENLRLRPLNLLVRQPDRYHKLFRDIAGPGCNTQPAYLSDPVGTPHRIFPATPEALDRMNGAQITAFAVWYGLDGVAIPAAPHNVGARRTALREWICH